MGAPMHIGESRPPPQVHAPEPRSTESPPAAASSDDAPSPFARILRGLGREVDRGEHMVRNALHGGDLGPGELLALQAGVYRYSEAVDLSAKLVDRATNGVKTVIQGQ